MDVPEKDYAFFDVEVADSGCVRELGAIVNGKHLHIKKVDSAAVQELGE